MTGRISPVECAAMRMLFADGWTKGELKMTFQAGTVDTVGYHLQNECQHPRVQRTVERLVEREGPV